MFESDLAPRSATQILAPAAVAAQARQGMLLEQRHMTSGRDIAVATIGLTSAIAAILASNLVPAALLLAGLGVALNAAGCIRLNALTRAADLSRSHYLIFRNLTLDIGSIVAIVLALGLTGPLRFDLACMAVAVFLAAALSLLIRQTVMAPLLAPNLSIVSGCGRMGAFAALTLSPFASVVSASESWGVISNVDVVVGALAMVAGVAVLAQAAGNRQALAKLDPGSRSLRMPSSGGAFEPDIGGQRDLVRPTFVGGASFAPLLAGGHADLEQRKVS